MVVDRVEAAVFVVWLGLEKLENFSSLLVLVFSLGSMSSRRHIVRSSTCICRYPLGVLPMKEVVALGGASAWVERA